MRVFKQIRSNFHSAADILLFLRIFSLITILPLLVNYLTVPQLMRALTPAKGASGRKSRSEDLRNKVEKYTDYILDKGILIYRRICLKRSLVLYHFLRKYGIDVHICFGVRYKKASDGETKKELEGHAWLLHDGNIFLEKNPAEEINTYKMTYCFPGEGGSLS
ncbi:MAG: lasso peptide biosynthesis B2 protein [Nitrospiraceae bacterium]|nr:MAG: lasso peptide biosynthesis B2 protein [Nitrospiraceae bacterium]